MNEFESSPAESVAESPVAPAESPTLEAGADTTSTEETTDVTVDGETAPAEDSTVEEPELDDPYDGSPDKISDDQKQYFYRAGKAKQMMAALDFTRQLDSVMPGATIQDLETHYRRSVNATQMVEDFHSEEPQTFGRWMDFQLDPESTSPQTVAMLADGLMERLPQHFPQVFDRVRSSVMGGEIVHMYDEAVRTGDEGLLKLAQNLDFKVNGTFKQAQDVARRDPLAEREAAIARREAEFTNRFKQDRQSQIQQFMQNTDIAEQDAVSNEIESLLTKDAAGNPIAHMAGLKSSPDWDYLRHQIDQKVTEARRASPNWSREYGLLRARATQNPSAESRQAVVDKMRSLVNSVVRANRKGWISQLSAKTLSASAQAQAKAQAGAARREPSGGGRAVNPTGDLAQRTMQMAKSGKSAEEILAAALR